MTTLFISYSRANSAIVYDLADLLRTQGYEVWTDVTGIVGGAVWQAAIQQAIRDCDAVIVALSAASTASPWVEREILFALDQHKAIIPLMLEEVPLPLSLYNLQKIDYTTNREHGLAELLRALPKPGLPKEPPAPVRPTLETAPREGMSLVGFRRWLAARQEEAD